MIKKVDMCFKRFNDLRLLVYFEHLKQIKKHGINRYYSYQWLSHLTKQVGQLADAVECSEYIHGAPKIYRDTEVVKQAIEVATLALKIAEMYLPNIDKKNYRELFNKGFNK
jgi:hypothetical protein